MSDETLREIQAMVISHDQDIALGRQRMEMIEARGERAFQAIAKAEAKAEAEAEQTRRALSRLFDRVGNVEGNVKEINGGIKTLKWLIPAWLTAGGMGITVLLYFWSGQ